MVDKGTNDPRRQWLAQKLVEKNLDATNLSRKLGKSPGFIRDFLKGKKRGMSADAWEAIEKELGVMVKVQLEPHEVVAAFEVLLQLYLGSDVAAQEAAQALLEVLSSQISLPAGVTRDAAIRTLIHQIVTQLARQ
jgi:hypothetical protein